MLSKSEQHLDLRICLLCRWLQWSPRCERCGRATIDYEQAKRDWLNR
jgi:hypothetical protein